MSDSVPQEIYEILNKVVEDEISNYEVKNAGGNNKGAGYLGEMCYLSIENKATKKILNVIVKQAFRDPQQRELCFITEIYANEVYFYSEIWPAFKKFQTSVLSSEVFNKIPKCLATTSEINAEKIVLENLKFEHFQTFNKRDAFNRQHFEFIFNEYGKFHALSFAYKERNPEEFLELVGRLTNVFAKFIDSGFAGSLDQVYKIAMTTLITGKEDKIIKKLERYIGNLKLLERAHKYEGKYSALLHGDSWSNNMMFKYNENNQLVDLRLIDFQICALGTPVCDLSYCLYSGGKKEIFDNLDYYLKLYHDSLSKTLREFGLDPLQLFPFAELKNDWKKHCQFGFMMGLNLWKMKLTEEGHIVDITDYDGSEDELMDKFMTAKYDEVTFKERARDLLLHMHENDFL